MHTYITYIHTYVHTYMHTYIYIYTYIHTYIYTYIHTWSDNKARELFAVKVLHTSLLNTTVVVFKVLPLGSYAPMPAPSPPFKTILELVSWNGLQSCRCITSGVVSVIKMTSFQYFLYLREQKSHWGLDPVNRQGFQHSCLFRR